MILAESLFEMDGNMPNRHSQNQRRNRGRPRKCFVLGNFQFCILSTFTDSIQSMIYRSSISSSKTENARSFKRAFK